jgi:hypothetical protein
MRARESGMTMVEVAIGVTLTIIVLGLAYPGFNLAGGAISACTQSSRLQEAGDKVTGQLIDILRLGQLGEIGPQGVPPYAIVDRPPTGIALEDITATGEVPWSGLSVRLQFRQTGTVYEGTIRCDLNIDGDRKDLFALGVLEVVTAEGARPITHRGKVLLGLPSYAGDVDGDGEDDPLFSVNGRRLEIELVMVQREDSGVFRRAAMHRNLYLRNRQD